MALKSLGESAKLVEKHTRTKNIKMMHMIKRTFLKQTHINVCTQTKSKIYIMMLCIKTHTNIICTGIIYNISETRRFCEEKKNQFNFPSSRHESCKYLVELRIHYPLKLLCKISGSC